MEIVARQEPEYLIYLSHYHIVFVVFSNQNMKRVLEVYSLPGKWYYFKYIFVVALLSIRKLLARYFPQKNSKPGYGSSSHKSLVDMDRRQPLSNDPKAFDAVYINGSNRIGWYIIVGLAVRPENVDGFMILKVPGVGLLLSPKLPDTVLKRDSEDDDCFTAEGLSFNPVHPTKAWHLQYRGKMRFSHKAQKKVNVVLDATWKSNLKLFNYDTDVLSKNIAKAMSLEEWSANYFQCLRDHHQTHYEQFGDLTGNIVIDNVDFNINMSAVRDHSFGVRREWKALHRYVMHIFTLADGRRGTVGVVCIPNLFSRLEIGYVYGKDGCLDAVHNVEFELYQHGECGTSPSDYGFTFMAGKKGYEVNVHVEECTELFLGLEWEARIVESLCRYTINGVEGWGVVEWMYSHAGGRPH